jgi:hypothetical protein
MTSNFRCFILSRWYHTAGYFMRLLMGIVRDRHGTYYARKKVPPRLQEAVARVLNNGKTRPVWLKAGQRLTSTTTMLSRLFSANNDNAGHH